MSVSGEKTIASRTSAQPTTFYCSWFCPYAQRAWICLEEKGVPYQYVEIVPYKADPSRPGGATKNPLSLKEKRERYPEFVHASPHGLVPAVRHNRPNGDVDVVHDSLVVCEYLDEMFPTAPHLLPKDPGLRARVRNCVTDMSQRVLPSFYKMLMARTTIEQNEHKQNLLQGFLEFAKGMQSPGVKHAFFLGDVFSLADVAALPWFQRMLSVGAQYRGIIIPRDREHARLWQWYDSCVARPSVANTVVCERRLVQNYSGYADGTATSDVATNLVGIRPGGSDGGSFNDLRAKL